MKRIANIIIAALALTIASPSHAQDNRQDKLLMEINPILSNAFAKAVELTPSQRQRLSGVVGEGTKRVDALVQSIRGLKERAADEEEYERMASKVWTEGLEAVARIIDPVADKVLTPDQEIFYSALQIKRLVSPGFARLWEGYGAERLKLTPDQRSTLAKIAKMQQAAIDRVAIDPEMPVAEIKRRGEENVRITQQYADKRLNVLDKRQTMIVKLAIEMNKEDE